MEEILTRYWPQLAAVVAIAVTWGDLRHSLKAHQRTTQDGFVGVNSRLDKVNGRLDKHGERLLQHAERISKLED